MKKTIMLCLSVFLLCIGVAACSDNDDKELVEGVYLYAKTIECAYEAGEQSVTVAATTDWTVSSDSEWLTISVNNGSTGYTAVNVSWTENIQEDERIGTLTFSAGKYQEKLVVTQTAK